ncbi:chorismate-binding protein [Catellatospora methionotrophica]|uniref:chorismate-binding protein n=1 Tax=Catellatospora methionotrophica TaxID=121620 RepID=UPI0033EB3B03
MTTGENSSYWERACRFFRGSGWADTAGSYLVHNKNSGTVKIGLMPQRTVSVGGGILRCVEDGRQTLSAPVSEDQIFKRVEQSLHQDAPSFFIVSPDLRRRYVDSALPLVLFVQPAVEFTFSAEHPDGRIGYARDPASEQQGADLLRAALAQPLPAPPYGAGEPGEWAELADGWTPAEDDDSFLARLTDAVGVLQEHPDGKMTLTRAYTHPRDPGHSPFTLYELHARRNGDYACGHFACLDDGVYSLGTTPENILEVDGPTLTVDVVAATCRSTGDEEYLAAELYDNPKQLKEHRSSLRNRQDRFRPYCRPDSIRVVQDMRVKTLRNVCHLHSVFTGELLPGVTVFDMLDNIFPLLGARPRQLLAVADAEPAPHRYYGGVFGHLHRATGGCFLNIRNALLHDDVIHAKVGVGVLKESNPYSELVETRDKLAGLLEATRRWRSAPREDRPDAGEGPAPLQVARDAAR